MNGGTITNNNIRLKSVSYHAENNILFAVPNCHHQLSISIGMY